MSTDIFHIMAHIEKERDWETWLGDVTERTRKVGKESKRYMKKNFPASRPTPEMNRRERNIQLMGKGQLQLVGEFNDLLRAEEEAGRQAAEA